MEQLLDDVFAYWNHLHEDEGLSVSVHFDDEHIRRIPAQLLARLRIYNTHNNAYCMAVKGKRGKKQMCLCHQRDILKKCADLDAFSTVCHAGVLEFVRAVRVEDRVVAYVVASGYRKGNAPSALPDAALWRGALRDMPPAPDRFRALLAPLCRMLELLFSCPVTSEDGEYNRILQYLNENYANATLDDLCRYTARSRSYISHMFRAKSGMTLRAYCNEWRLAVAKRLLRTTDRSVSEIGWDVGFHDTGYFIRTFRTAFGITPLRYRAKHTL